MVLRPSGIECIRKIKMYIFLESQFYINVCAILASLYRSSSLRFSICIYERKTLKSLSPIDRKFHGHGENDGFVLYEYIIKQFISFCKYTNISVMKKSQIKYHVNINRKYVLFIGNIVSYLVSRTRSKL